MKKYNDIFLDILPQIDLHGYDRESAIVETSDFITENIILNNNKIVIIHGIGQGILKDCIHAYLLKDKRISSFKIDNFNSGCTIVNILIDKN